MVKSFFKPANIPLLATVLGLVVFVGLNFADPGLNASSLEVPSGLLRISIREPGDPTSEAVMALPGGSTVRLLVARGPNRLRFLVIEAPEGSPYSAHESFDMVYSGQRIFKCEGACGIINLMQS